MMRLSRLSVIALTLCVGGASVRADEWRHLVAAYGWASSLDANVTIKGNEADSEADFADVLENVEFAGLMRYEGHGEKWGILFDGIYLGLGYGLMTGGGDVDIDTTVLELAGSYHANQYFEFLFGARYMDLTGKIDFDVLPDVRRSASWADGIAGFRATVPMGEHWKWFLRGDVGAGGSDFAWNGESAFVWSPNERFGLAVGWRALSTDYDKGSGADEMRFDALLSGPELGFVLRF